MIYIFIYRETQGQSFGRIVSKVKGSISFIITQPVDRCWLITVWRRGTSGQNLLNAHLPIAGFTMQELIKYWNPHIRIKRDNAAPASNNMPNPITVTSWWARWRLKSHASIWWRHHANLTTPFLLIHWYITVLSHWKAQRCLKRRCIFELLRQSIIMRFGLDDVI